MDDARAAALLAGVLAAPDDDAPRLIYADHLIERGDPHGELIQVECALAAAPPKDPRRADLDARALELLAQLEPRFAPRVEHARYETRRGFIDRIYFHPRTLVRCLPELLSGHPIRRVDVFVSDDEDVELIAAQAIPRTIELALHCGVKFPLTLDVDAPAVATLFDGRTRLALHHIRARDDQWFALLESPACASVRAIELVQCHLPSTAVAALADPRVFPALDDLELHVVSDLALAEPELTALGARLVRLANLYWEEREDARRGMAALLAESRLRELDYARLRSWSTPLPTIEAIVASPRARTVRTLRIWLDRPEMLAAILDSPHLADLANLHVDPVPEPEHLAGFAAVLRAHRDRDLVLHWNAAPLALREVAPELFAIPAAQPRRK